MRNAIFAATLVFSSAAVFGVTDNLREQAESSSNANMTEVKQVELAGSGGNVAGEKNLKRAASISHIFLEDVEKIKEIRKANAESVRALWSEKVSGSKISEMEIEIEELKKKNKDLKSYIESLTHSFDYMTEEMLFWKNSYQPNMKKIARLTNKLEKTKAELKENIEDRRSDINWWKDQYDERVREIENLTKKIKLLSDKLERKERIIQELKNGKSIIKEIDNLSINSDSTAFD